MRWEVYYGKLSDWAVSTAVSRMAQLESFGPPEEVVDAVNIIAFEDDKGALRLLKKALAAGVRFTGDQLSELCLICDEETLKQAVLRCADWFSTADLDALYGFCDEELLVEIAHKRRIGLPASLADYAEAMRFSPETEEDSAFSPEELAGEYDYILDCLLRAHGHLEEAYKFAAMAASSGDRAPTVVQYRRRYDAQEPLDRALEAWERLEPRYRGTVSLEGLRHGIGSGTALRNFFTGNVFTNMLVRRRIRVVLKRVATAYNAVLRLRGSL